MSLHFFSREETAERKCKDGVQKPRGTSYARDLVNSRVSQKNRLKLVSYWFFLNGSELVKLLTCCQSNAKLRGGCPIGGRSTKMAYGKG